MFKPFVYETKDKDKKQYNGRLALTLGWTISYSLPQEERYVIITPANASDFIYYIENFVSSSCVGNLIRLVAYKWGDYKYMNCYTDEPGYLKFNEIKPVKKPAVRKNKWGEIPVYEWVNGKWLADHYVKVDDEE